MEKNRQTTDARDADLQDLLLQVEAMSDHFEAITSAVNESQRLATVGTLAALLAHEFNNILTPIISYAQLALSKPDDTALARKALEKSLAGAERASKISTALLGFAHGEKGGSETCYLPDAVQSTLDCLGRDPAKDGIHLTIDVAEAHLAIDPIHLQQVLLNLIINARRALLSKGSCLSISATTHHNDCLIVVSDDGPGIPAEIADTLFQPFVSAPNHEPDPQDRASEVDTAELGEPSGTGLGLSLCKELLEQAGGSIRVESVAGRGATFYLSVPLAEDISARQPRSAA